MHTKARKGGYLMAIAVMLTLIAASGNVDAGNQQRLTVDLVIQHDAMQ